MKCEDYREAIGADPNFDGGEAHVRDCTACQAYRREMQALDRQIRRALALEVPPLAMPELEDIDSVDVVALETGRGRPTPVWLAVAATVLIAAFVGLWITTGPDNVDGSLGEQVLAHIKHEPASLQVTDVGVTDERLYEVVPASVAAMDHSAGLITYAETCPINGNAVPHLVVQGEKGPITILLMPEEKVSSAITLNDEDSHGVILPVGDGSIAIVGPRDEELEKVQKQVLRAVVWTT